MLRLMFSFTGHESMELCLGSSLGQGRVLALKPSGGSGQLQAAAVLWHDRRCLGSNQPKRSSGLREEAVILLLLVGNASLS